MAKRKSEVFGRGLLPHKKEVKLLYMSQVLGDHDRLREILDGHGIITKKVFGILSPDDQSYLRTNVLPVLKQAQKEWFILEDEYKDLGEDWETLEPPTHCDLCGEKLRHMHCIERRDSDRRLIIGGTCKDDFVTEDGVSAEEVEVKRRELFRRVELGNKFEGISDAVRDSERIFDTFDLMIPDSLKNPYYRAVEDLTEQYERYVKGKENTTINLKPVWEQFRKTRQALMDYNEKNENDRWKATRKIEINFRTDLNDKNVELLNKYDCTITPLILHRIREPTFLKTLIPDWNDHLLGIGIKINRVSQDSPAYIYTYAEEPGLDLIISHKVLAENFGHVLFGENPLVELTARNVVIRSVPYRTPQSLRKVLTAIGDSVSILGLEVEGVYEDTHRVIFFDTNDKIYLQVNITRLMQNVGPIVSFREDGLEMLKKYLQGPDVEILTTEQLQRQKEAGWAYREDQRAHRRR